MRKFLVALLVLTMGLAMLTSCGHAGYNEKNTNESNISESIVFISNGDGTCNVSSARICTDTQIVIPAVSPDGDIVTGLAEYAFFDDDSLISITIPDTVVSIGKYALKCCKNLDSIKIYGNGSIYHVDGNCLIETKTKKLILGFNNSVIPSDGSVTSIEDYAFWGNIDNKKIVIPGKIEYIGKLIFETCYSLTDVDFVGTQDEWNAITKDVSWAASTSVYFVHCVDGDVPLGKG